MTRTGRMALAAVALLFVATGVWASPYLDYSLPHARVIREVFYAIFGRWLWLPAAAGGFMGAAALCIKQGLPYDELLTGIAAACRYTAQGDHSAARMQEMVAEQGLTGFLATHCGLSADDCRTVGSIYQRADV